jgi:hypothetical protein
MIVQRNIEGRAVLQISGSSQVIMPFIPMEESGEGHLVTALL